ncbi:MAG: NAD(P)H-binding protein [Candidatus Sumerlaeota bacterium]|nr:NAD(P)H-binding protein [Candidatus Sumerlaeota bacterium]
MILVTGATSHTGSRLVKRLVERQQQVRCLVHSPQNTGCLPVGGVEIIQGDLREESHVCIALKNISILISVAHISFAPALIPLCREAGVNRVIFMSSTRRYTKFPCESSAQVIEAEEAILRSGLNYTILRPSMIYGGPEDNNITRLVRQIRRHRIFPLFGSGANLIQPVFVWDLVEAIFYCVEHQETSGKDYTLAGPEPITYRRAVEIIAAALEKKIILVPVPLSLCILLAGIYKKMVRRPRLTAEQVRRFGEDKVFDITLARREIGFSPRPFEEGIRLKLAGEA